MFDVDDFVQECRAAVAEEEPRREVREVVERAVGARSRVADTLLRPQASGFTLLHHDADLTVLHVVCAPHMSMHPHDHAMWAVIGVYAGQEDNRFFRRVVPGAGTLSESGGKRLESGEVAVLGVNTIHAVTNPRDRLTGASHVYGGDFVNQPRCQWGPGAPVERPYDIAEAQRQFDETNATWQTGAGPQ